jgi:hypothetical protein
MITRYATIAVLSVAALAATPQAQAHDNAGPYIAGALTGLIVGAAIANPPAVYVAPPPVVYAPPPPPVYYAPPRVVYYGSPPPAVAYFGARWPRYHYGRGWHEHHRGWDD